LAASDAGRLKDLLPLRYGRMLESPFTFLRGAASVMAADLAGTPTSGLLVQACGDAHLANFGIFGAPERNLVFDVNDFDETLPGPWEWDLKRLATSAVVAGRSSHFSEGDAVAAASAVSQSYRLCMWGYARMRHLEVWYSQIKSSAVAKVLPTISRATIRRRLKQARRRDNLQALDKLTTVVDQQVRLIEDPPLLTHTHEDVLGGSIDVRMNTTCIQFRTIAASCWSGTGSSTPPAKSWASAASGHGATCCCSSVVTTTIHSFCR